MQDRQQLQHAVKTTALVERQYTWSHRRRCLPREDDPLLRLVHHVTDKTKLIAPQQFLLEKILMPLDRHLPDLLTLTLMRKPRMIKIGTHKHQFEIVDSVDMITHYPPRTLGVHNEVQL